MKTVLKSLVAVLAIVVAWQLARVDDATNQAKALPFIAPPKVPPGGLYKGMAIQLHGGADVYERYHRLIPEIAELGANSVLFVVHGWQDHAGSLDLHIDANRTASAEGLGKLLDDAARHKLRTILMPIVLLANPRNTEWRGRIIPADRDWDEWFKRYRAFIVHFAKIAERHNVELFMVGSELIKTEGYRDRWLRVIEDVRQEYRGKLGYSANWDHYQPEKISFWDKLDCVGMTTYYELAKGPNPKAAEIERNWERIRREIRTIQQEVNKPIVFTEVGWCSQEGAAHEGWNYYANQKATAAGLAEQKLLYEAFLKTWSNEEGVGGIIWWEWDTSPGGPENFNYTPRGKPAEEILRQWFSEHLSENKRERPRAKPAAND